MLVGVLVGCVDGKVVELGGRARLTEEDWVGREDGELGVEFLGGG